VTAELLYNTKRSDPQVVFCGNERTDGSNCLGCLRWWLKIDLASTHPRPKLEQLSDALPRISNEIDQTQLQKRIARLGRAFTTLDRPFLMRSSLVHAATELGCFAMLIQPKSDLAPQDLIGVHVAPC
jgi:hypothetical protein